MEAPPPQYLPRRGQLALRPARHQRRQGERDLGAHDHEYRRPGDLTLGNGIPVVVTRNGGTTAAEAFGLSGPVVSGPYEIPVSRRRHAGKQQRLVPPQRCRTNPPGTVRADPAPLVHPPVPDPPGSDPAGPSPVPIPFFRPEAMVYAGMPALAGSSAPRRSGRFMNARASRAS